MSRLVLEFGVGLYNKGSLPQAEHPPRKEHTQLPGELFMSEAVLGAANASLQLGGTPEGPSQPLNQIKEST